MVDEPLQDLGEKLRAAAQQSGADAVLTVMSPRATDGSEPPAPVAEALAACDVFIAPASRSLSHTLARKRASEGGARGATMPHVTADMLARLMSIDFDRLRSRSHAIADLLDKGTEAHVTCPRGTDLRLDLRGRQGIADDGDLTGAAARSATSRAARASSRRPGERGRCTPARSPRSASPAGTRRSSPSRTGTSRRDRPRGRAAPGHPPASTGTRARTSPSSGSARTIARPSPATSSRTRRSSGAIHVAFGASIAIGGTVSVPIHLDCVVTEASLDDRRHARAGRGPLRPRRLTRLNYPGAERWPRPSASDGTKHRGNAAGIVEVRGRTTRPREPRGAQAQRKGAARKARMDRYDQAADVAQRRQPRARRDDPLRRGHHLRASSSRAKSAIALGGFMLLLYIPIGYYTDSFFYNRRQQQIARSARRRRQVARGRPRLHRRAVPGEHATSCAPTAPTARS